MMQRKVRSAALWLAGLVVSRGLAERRQRRRGLTGRLWGAAAALLLAAGLSGQAVAEETGYPVTLSYEFHEGSGLPEVTNMMVFNTYTDGGGGATWPFGLTEGFGTLTDPFAKSTGNAPLTGLWLGVWNDSTNDHLLMALSNTNTPSGTIDTTFAPATEAGVITSLRYITSNDRDDDEATWDGHAATVDSFVGVLQGLGYAFALPAPVPVPARPNQARSGCSAARPRAPAFRNSAPAQPMWPPCPSRRPY
jgi:hypothetical protein